MDAPEPSATNANSEAVVERSGEDEKSGREAWPTSGNNLRTTIVVRRRGGLEELALGNDTYKTHTHTYTHTYHHHPPFMTSAVSVVAVPTIPSNRDRDNTPSSPLQPLSTTAVTMPSLYALLVKSTVFTLAVRDCAISVVALLIKWSKRWPPSSITFVTIPLAPPPSRVFGPLAATATLVWPLL